MLNEKGKSERKMCKIVKKYSASNELRELEKKLEYILVTCPPNMKSVNRIESNRITNRQQII